MSDDINIIAVRGPGAPGGMVHAATDEDSPDFVALCGVEFTSVFFDGDERAEFSDFVAGAYHHKHICIACTEATEEPMEGSDHFLPAAENRGLL